LQGDSPLALISISLLGPYFSLLTVTKKFSTPVGFGDNSTQVLNDVVIFTITKPWMDGTYSPSSIALDTQACPLHTSTEIFPEFAYAMAGGGSGTARLGSQHYLSAFSLPTLTFGSGHPPAITPPKLLSFQRESSPVVSNGGQMLWNYTVQLGNFPLTSVMLSLDGPLLLGGQYPQGFGTRTFTVPVGAGGLAGAGTVVAGKISVSVTSAWIPGAYNFAGSYPMIILTTATPQPVRSYTIYRMGGDSYSDPYDPQSPIPNAPCFSFDQLAFDVTPSRPTPQLTAPQLLSLQYTGPAEVRAGDEMVWEYSILQGSGPMAQMSVNLVRCVEHSCSYLYLKTELPAAIGGSGSSSDSGYGSGSGSGYGSASGYYSGSNYYSGSGSLSGGGNGGTVIYGTVSVVAGTVLVLPPPAGSGFGSGSGRGRGTPSSWPMLMGQYTYSSVCLTSKALPESDMMIYTYYYKRDGRLLLLHENTNRSSRLAHAHDPFLLSPLPLFQPSLPLQFLITLLICEKRQGLYQKC
jgi:hypothetical protein